jgi:SWIM zinc finger
MATTDSSAPAHPSTREARGLELYRRGGIERIARDVYRVPSCSGSGSYDVLYGEREECSCPDYLYGNGRACKHLLAVGIMHAAKRSGVKVHTIPAAIAGDPFAHAAKRRDCSLCFGGYVTITVEEDGIERDEAVPCRRCADSR